MEDKIIKATHEAPLKIGGHVIKCAVLEDGTRVITQRSVYSAMGRHGSTGGLKPKNGAQELPRILTASNLSPFISNELRCAIVPILFKPKSGGRPANGYRAEILPEICNVYLEAREADVLSSTQQNIAAQCEILIRAFAKIGIIALVDEVTGYQYDRERDDLEKLLAIYLTDEKLKWAKRFPDAFYRYIYKLKNWPYPQGSGKTPYVGRLTNELIYDKLPPGVLPKLRELNPVDPKTKRRHACHHQYLTVDIGQLDLRDHLMQVIALLKASANWSIFKRLFARAFPTKTQLEEQRQMNLYPEQEDDLI